MESVKIRIPGEIMAQWKKVYQYGDFSRIAAECNSEPYVIHRIYKNGIGDEKIVGVMAKFFKSKNNRILKAEKIFGRAASRSSFHDR